MKHITCIEDLRQVHMRKVPKAFFDYADRGSYAEETLRANRDDLQQIKFRQRVLVDVSKRDLSTTLDVEPRKPRLAWQGMERRELAGVVPTQVVEIVHEAGSTGPHDRPDVSSRHSATPAAPVQILTTAAQTDRHT